MLISASSETPVFSCERYLDILFIKVKWCIYIVPFPCNMLKDALQWSVYPQRTGSIYRRLWQPLQIGPGMLVLILPTPGGWKAEWTLAGKKVTQIFNPRPGRESNREPQDWEAEILTTAPTPPFINAEVALIRKLQPHIALVFEKYNFLAGNEISFICYIPTVDGRGCVLIDLQSTQEVGWW